MATAAILASPPAQESFALAHPQDATSLPVLFKRISAQTGQSVGHIVRDFAALARGPGRVSFRDYVNFRLFDAGFYANSDRRTVVGQRRNRDLIVDINYRHDWFAVLTNKIAMTAYLAAHGLPVVSIEAIYAPALSPRTGGLSRSRTDMRRFLLDAEHYPMFGKPADGFQSLGSIALRGVTPSADALETDHGTLVPIDKMLDDVEVNFGTGYIFQRLLAPAAELQGAIGRKLATSRIVTMVAEDGPRILRASLKIPTGHNSADNYWRDGNLLAHVDVATGRLGRTVTGCGFSLAPVATHPDTGARLDGVIIPNWQRMCEVALEGARVMCHVPLIGWDVASTDCGPVIVEMNETPDLSLNQLPTGLGILQPDFLAFMAFQKSAAASYVKQCRIKVGKL